MICFAVVGCRKVLDLVLAIDGSDSISDPDFDKIKSSVDILIQQLDIGKDKIHVGVVLYSSDITDAVDLLDDKDALSDVVVQLKPAHMGTNTALGIETLRTILNSGRPDAPKMGVVITDGKSLDPNATRDAAESAIADGIAMFSIGIGGMINLEELKGIASGPEDSVTFGDFDGLSLDDVAKEICPSK